MPRKTAKTGASGGSGRSSGDDKVARPKIEEIAAEEELREDEKDGEKETPPAPGEAVDNRKRCPHGRLWKCKSCEVDGKTLSPEQKAERRDKLEDALGQFYNAVFNITSLLTGDENVRLTREERHGLSTTGATAAENVAPEVSIPALAVFSHVVTLGGLITEKCLGKKKEDGKESTPGRSGDEADGKDDPRKTAFKIPVPA